MTYYLKIIKSEDMEWTGKYGRCLDGEITEYNGLRQITRPYNNAAEEGGEKIILTYQNGSTETVTGHYIGSGQEENSQA